MSNTSSLYFSENETLSNYSENDFPLFSSLDFFFEEKSNEVNAFTEYHPRNLDSSLQDNNLGGILIDEEKDEQLSRFHKKIHELSSVVKIESFDQSSTNMETIHSNETEKKLLFDVIYPHIEEEGTLFSIGGNDCYFDVLFEEDEKNFIGKRFSKKRPRKENKDNILKKVKRRFLNITLINKLNEKLKSIGIKLFFQKFPQSFASNVTKKNNKILLNMTLLEIFEKKELYEDDLANYVHNIKVVESEEVMQNKIMINILNKTYKQLFEEYLNSVEFKIGEINELKKHKMNNDSIKRYIYATKHFIEFFSQQV